MKHTLIRSHRADNFRCTTSAQCVVGIKQEKKKKHFIRAPTSHIQINQVTGDSSIQRYRAPETWKHVELSFKKATNAICCMCGCGDYVIRIHLRSINVIVVVVAVLFRSVVLHLLAHLIFAIQTVTQRTTDKNHNVNSTNIIRSSTFSIYSIRFFIRLCLLQRCICDGSDFVCSLL